MAETSKMNLADHALGIAGHARDIAFAVFRVAELVEQKKLRAALESAAIDLVSQCGDLPYLPYVPEGVRLPYLPYIEKLNELIRLAEMVDEIKPVNSQVLQRELQNLYSTIAESIGKGGDINLEDMFEKEPVDNAPTTNKEIAGTVNFEDAPTRQSAILEFVKQLPNGCRMKDLMVKFPSVSERTLRNDLQILAAEGKIERFGAVQGPFSYFRVKTVAPAGDDLPAAPETGLEAVTKNEIISL